MTNNTLKKIAQNTPTTLGGLLLGVASTGNLFPNFRYIFAIISIILLIVVINKIVFDLPALLSDIKSPVGGVVITIPVAFSVLSTYIVGYIPEIAKVSWILSFIIALLILITHTIYLLSKRELNNINPSTFIMYVGISVNAFVAATHGYAPVGKILLMFSTVSFIILLPLIIYRLIKVELPIPMKPMLAIFSSPASVILNAYLILFQEMLNPILVYIILAVSITLWIFSLSTVPKAIKNGFYPSYASLTFPFVVTAASAKSLHSLFVTNSLSSVYAYMTQAIALLLVIFVLSTYTKQYIFNK